jgi:hypothetical protein
MSVLILIPGLISLFLVLRGRVETAFLSVYLPSLLLLPETYALRIPHFPPTSAAEYALIPIGFVAIARLIRSGSFALMDVLVVLFAASVGFSEILHSPVLNDAIFSAFDAFVSILLAYMVGRQLIEPDLRFATVRRFVVLVLLLGPAGLYEWKMGQSLYGIIGDKFLGLGGVSESVQMRSGHGRMASAFSGAEPAGIAFAMTACLNAWLVYLQKIKANVDLGKTLTKLEKYHVPGLLLLLYVWLTQSRGPQIALAAAYLILQITRFKNTRIMTIVVAVLLVAGYLGSSAYFSSYTNVTDVNAVSEQQSSAVYRRQMNEMYAPIAEQGGWTGWGLLEIPHVEGMTSIDNHFLLVHLAWGRLSYFLFVLIAWENLRVLITRTWQFKAWPDRAFAISMLAAMTVLWISLLTVYLGEQLPQIAFLLIGWTQSMVATKTATSTETEIPGNQNRKFAFQRVFG